MAMESNIYANYVAKQSAKGTAASTPTKRTVMVAGDFNPNRDDASENYSDLDRFGNQSDWVNTLVGNGNPGIEATPGELAYLLWLFMGGESVTGGTSQVNSITSTGTGGTVRFSWTVSGITYTTGAIAFNATTAAVNTAFQAATSVDGRVFGTNVTVTGAGPLGTGALTVTWSGIAANQAITLTADNTALTGGTAVPTTTTPGVAATHTFTPNVAGGFWSTWWLRVGATQIRRHKFNDCRIGNLQIEGSTANKAVRATPTIISLDPAETFTADPTTGMPVDARAFLYTEGSSAYVVDGVAITGQSQFTLIFDEGLAPIYGDNVVPVDLVPGNASISVAVTLQLDQNGLNQYNKIIYGTTTPGAGAKPIKSLPNNGSWQATLTKDTNTAFTMSVPNVKWSPDMAMPPNPDGGAVELALAGSMRKVPGQQAATLTVKNADPAYTV